MYVEFLVVFRLQTTSSECSWIGPNITQTAFPNMKD